MVVNKKSGYYSLALAIIKSAYDERDTAFFKSSWGEFLCDATLGYYFEERDVQQNRNETLLNRLSKGDIKW